MRKLSFDPNVWADFPKDKAVTAEAFAHVNLSAPGAVYVETDLGWQLVHYGTEMKITLPRAGMKIKASVAGALYIDAAEPLEETLDVLTNMDKRPGQDGAMSIFNKIQAMERVKANSAAILAAEENKKEAKRRIDKGLTDKLPEGVIDEPEDEPVVEPDPAPTPDPATAAE